jgi:inner membrane transporter RhtA
VFSQVVGSRLPGLQGSAIAMTTAATCTLPILVVTLVGLAPDARLGVLASGGLAGLLSTIIPQAIDMTVLRRMSRRVFGVLQSASPALAAMVGFILLHQTLGLWQIAGLLIVSGANVVAVLAAGRTRIPVAVEPGAIDPTPTEPVGVVAGDGS